MNKLSFIAFIITLCIGQQSCNISFYTKKKNFGNYAFSDVNIGSLFTYK